MEAANSIDNNPNPPRLDGNDDDPSLASLADAVAATSPFVTTSDDAAAALDEPVPDDILELWANVGQSVDRKRSGAFH